MSIRVPFALAALASLAGLAAVHTPSADAQPAVRTETVYDSYDGPVFTTGAVVLTASYGAALIAASSRDDLDELYVPLAGPWLALAGREGCPIEKPECDDETTTKLLLVADGVFQAAGALAMLDAILEPSRRTIVRPVASQSAVRVTPTASTGGPGVLVVGRF